MPRDEETRTVQGSFQLHPSGRGFVDLGEAYEDIVVDRGDQGAALDGDVVEVEAWPGRTREKGRVTRVVSRGRTRLTGVMEQGAEITLRPDDPRIKARVLVLDSGGARPGQVVLGKIISYPESADSSITVEISRVLGEQGRLVTEVAKCIAGAGVEEDFPAEVVAAADSLSAGLQPGDEDDRLDLRGHHFVTIDPRTARDFDDAVAVEEGPGETIRVWVAVADVSHYVPEDSLLDQEARVRGCSVYLPDRSIPMLPGPLSARICSLVPGSDRLAMVVRLDVDASGNVVDEDCAAALIHSHGQLDYGGVAAALQGDFAGLRESYRDHAELLDKLKQVAVLLRGRRLDRGSLDLDLPEAQVILDQDDPERIRDVVQGRPDTPIKQAYGLVEELMIAANEAVGRCFQDAGMTTIWRIHPPPHPRALGSLSLWMRSYGVKTSAIALRSDREISRLARRLQGHPAARSLSYLILRTLNQAVYATNNVGHFGLASPTYLHFTSPIRRYPDLHVHRLLKALLRHEGKPSGGAGDVRQISRRDLSEIALQTTASERRAIDAEREIQRVYAASAMRDRIGEELEGTVSGISSFGFFVTLDRPFVDGLVKLDTLNDWMEFDADQLRLFGDGRTISLGDRLRVQVVNASVSKRKVDLKPVEDLEARKGSRSRGKRRGRREGHKKDHRGGKGGGNKRRYSKRKR